MRKVTFLGNRQQELGGFKENELQKSIKDSIENTIKELSEQDKVILCTTGFTGIPMWSAMAARKYDLSVHLYVPYDEPYKVWPKHIQMEYRNLYRQSTKKIIVNNGSFDHKKIIEAETKIIEDCDDIFTFFKEKNYVHSLAERFSKECVDLMPSGEEDDYLIEF